MQHENVTGNQQQNESIMTRPPSVLSTKDAMYLNDMLSWNLLAMKKANFFAQHCSDRQVVEQINKCGKMHQRHYESILSHLDPSMQDTQMQ